ncbi:MAG: tyrosine-type recombinase/integrase [Methanothrix sp.]
MRKQLKVDWSRDAKKADLEPALRKFQRYLENLGFSTPTIESYLFRCKKYLEFSQTDQPTEKNFAEFRDYLQDKRLARNTMNNYGFATRKYHLMIGRPVEFNYLKPNDTIPFYFDEEDVNKIFCACGNVKHYAMLVTMFYECLRVSELCNLNDEDVDFKAMSLRIKDGKWGREALIPLNPEVARVVKEYLAIRPTIIIDNKKPLFITDYMRRWHRADVHRMFTIYKKKAGVDKVGGVHVFGRHSPASILIKNGCDIMTVKGLMRHKDITTTARYLHISDEVMRQKHSQYLKI